MQFNFDKFLPKYGIDTPRRRAMFLAQCHHETAGFTRLEENLNYSYKRLLEVFPRYFSAKNAGIYACQPKKIASRVYANRMGNGDEKSGDGWYFRGRGLIQITGRANYARFAKTIGVPLEKAIVYLETADGALEGACWYWQTRDCNVPADLGDVKGCTRIINGGTNGLAERESLYARYLEEEQAHGHGM